MSEEITQEAVDEQTTQGEEETSTSQETGKSSAAESGATATESLSPERIAELMDAEKRYKALEPEFTRRSQELKRIQEESQTYREALKTLGGAQRPQADPLEIANQRFWQGLQEYDEEKIRSAQTERDRILVEQAIERAQQQALKAWELRQSIQSAQQEYGYTPEQLNETFNSIRDNPGQLAVLRAFQEGKLEDMIQKKAAAEKAAAERAALAASGMSGHSMGGLTGQGKKHEHVSPRTFISWAAHKQQKYVEKYGLPPGIEVQGDDDD